MRNYTMEYLLKNRKKQVECATRIREELKNKKHCGVIADFKSGKKEIKITVRLLGLSAIEKNKEAHIYITSLNSLDTICQKNELRENGLIPIVLKRQEDVEDTVSKISKLIEEYDIVYIHFDESDYGTEQSQLFSGIYQKLVNEPKTKWIYYSGSNEELKFSNLVDENCPIVVFEPESNFRSSKYFLENGLAFQARPFWDFESDSETPQCEEFLDYLCGIEGYCEHRYEDRTYKVPYISIVRLSYNTDKKSAYASLKESKNFKEYCVKRNIKCKFVDEKQPFNWDSLDEYEGLSPLFKWLIIINQTCKRSTEIKCHAFLRGWHDYRPGDTSYNTIMQSDGRINHYLPPNTKEYPIRIYGDLPSLQYNAGYISAEEYTILTGRSWSPRVKTTIPKRKYKVTYLCSLDIGSIIKEIATSASGERESRKVTLSNGVFFRNDTVGGNEEYDLASLATGPEPHKYTGIDKVTGETRGTWFNRPCYDKKKKSKKGTRDWEPLKSWDDAINYILSIRPEIAEYYNAEKREWKEFNGKPFEVIARYEIESEITQEEITNRTRNGPNGSIYENVKKVV